METFYWWLVEFLTRRAAWRFGGSLFQTLLGWILGGKYRSIRDNLRAFRRNINRGDAAAWLIENTSDFNRAESIFLDFRTAPNPIEEARAWAAMYLRLDVAGFTPDTAKFFLPDEPDTEYNYWHRVVEFETIAEERLSDFKDAVALMRRPGNNC